MKDADFLRRCLTLAARGRGHTGINPMVGAVLVRDGKIIAEAWHEEFGKDHAERRLLGEMGNGEMGNGDVLYVNLEPCCHRGKTPPCTDLIIEKGIKSVVYGMDDPNPLVAGKGVDQLRKAGVTVRGPLLRAESEWLNRGFISVQRKGRPWITLKRAQTKDGKIAKDDGSPLKITSAEQDAWSHEFLRATHDAILVGVQTIINDDPELTLRIPNKKLDQNNKLDQDLAQPFVIVLDPNLRIPVGAKVVREGTLVVTKDAEDSEDAEDSKDSLLKHGVKILEVPMKGNRFILDRLWERLTTPSGNFHGVASILVEGGPKTWEIFREAGIVDQEVTMLGRR